MRTLNNQKSGSTLLLTILVVSLLMVIVLSFTVVVRLELRAITNRIELEQARQNAKLGMHLALARLQRAAGPDQRVTATAGILGGGAAAPEAKHWTGVWERNPSGGVAANPEWLVSGTGADPLAGAGATGVYEIFPATDRDAAVKVPLIDVTEKGSRGGQIAYWVADEGSKASASARRHAVSTWNNPAHNALRRLFEYQSDFGVDLSHLFNSPDIGLTDAGIGEDLEKINSVQGLALFKDSANQPLAARNGELIHHAHDLTPLALGVLENPQEGGLKKNLSDEHFRDSFLATDETQKFLADKAGKLRVESGKPPSSMEGEPYFSPRPMLTEVVLYIGLFHTWSDAKLRVRYHVEAEFANPYSLPLEFPADFSGSYNRGSVLVFENMPTITVEDMTPGSPTPAITQNLNEMSAYSASDTRRYLNSWFEISPDGTANTPVLNPGEIYQVMEPNPSTQPRGLARDFGTVRWSASAGTRPSNTAQIRITAVHPSGGITLKVVPYGSGNPRDKTPILEFKGLKFDDFQVIKTFNSGPNPFSRATSSSYLQQDYIFAYHFRVLSDATDTGSMRDVVTGHDWRDPDFDSSDEFTDLSGNLQPKSVLLDPSYTDPSFIVLDPANLFSKLDQVMDLTSRNHKQDYHKTVLYDIPQDGVVSVGRLSSLHLYRKSPGLIGSPRGGDYNKAFDRYYFSPKGPKPGDPSTRILLNPSLLSLGEVAGSEGENDAENEMVAGQFNLNSTSVDAWAAVLSAPVLTPTAKDESGGGDVARPASFFRLPEYQGLDGNGFVVTDAELKKPQNRFAQGIRSLHDSAGRTQLRQLAEAIVDALRSRAEPFADLESFVNSGIVEDAIASVPDINQDLMEYANVYLTQNEVFTKLAPFASPRSDTFVIRAYGSRIDPATGERRSLAVCEALVQRRPDKLDGSDPATPADGLLNARKFHILSFRWLTDDEI